MKTGAAVVGVLVVLVGAGFAGQGLGYIPGSFMTGDIHWFWIGGAMVVAGAALLAFTFLRSPNRA
ncbi:MAG TPA: hypothetical protein DCF65_09155 [Chloroflexi bacterium]|nr:hypothetical protein [Chloroflexota bacterium]HAF19213.1 hypothetical protein [Chloroflexota bacterium]